MNPRNKYGWFAVVGIMAILTIAMVVAWVLWRQLTPGVHQTILTLVQENFFLLFGFGVLFLAAGIFILDGVIQNHIVPTAKIRSELQLIRTVNPAHRITINGSAEIEKLAMAINQWADDVKKMQGGMEESITQARAASDAEKNTLAEFLTELPQGMVVCNVEGQILLYNKQAKRLLADPSETSKKDAEKGLYSGYMGIGRSIFSV